MKTKILIAAMAAFIGLAPLAKADDLFSQKDLGGKFSANVGFVTEYLFRGLTQSGNGTPAVQGGFDFAHDSGVYLGTWGSSINFGGNIETDFYGGWSGDIGPNKIGLDVGAILYHYAAAPHSKKLDYWEGHVGVSKDFGFATGGLKFSYSPAWTGDTGQAEYLETNWSVPAGKYFTVALHAGHQWFNKNNEVGLNDYTDWSVGLNTGMAGFTVGVTYIGSDLPHGQLHSYGQDQSNKLIASISRSF